MVREIVYDTCEALWEILMPTYLKAPAETKDWKEILQGYMIYIYFCIHLGYLIVLVS